MLIAVDDLTRILLLNYSFATGLCTGAFAPHFDVSNVAIRFGLGALLIAPTKANALFYVLGYGASLDDGWLVILYWSGLYEISCRARALQPKLPRLAEFLGAIAIA